MSTSHDLHDKTFDSPRLSIVMLVLMLSISLFHLAVLTLEVVNPDRPVAWTSVFGLNLSAFLAYRFHSDLRESRARTNPTD